MDTLSQNSIKPIKKPSKRARDPSPGPSSNVSPAVVKKKRRVIAEEATASTSADASSSAVVTKEQVRTIVTGLQGFIRQNFEVRIRQLIQLEVRELSAIMNEYAVYVHFIFNAARSNQEMCNKYFNGPKKNNFQILLRLLYEVTGKVDRDPDYEAIRRNRINNGMRYDVKLRSCILQEQVKLYQTVLENNIRKHMYKRLVKYFTCIPDQNGRVMERREAIGHVKMVLSGEFYDERLGVWFIKDWKTKDNLFGYIPMLFRIQEALFNNANVKSFIVIPQLKAKAHHVLYTNSGLHEFYQRNRVVLGLPSMKRAEFMATKREQWQRFFDITRFENANNTFRCISTNSVKVCVLMNRKVVEVTTASPRDPGIAGHFINIDGNQLQHNVPNYDNIMGGDPGIRLIIGGVRYAVKEERPYEIVKEKSINLHHDAGYFSRKRKFGNYMAGGDMVEDEARIHRLQYYDARGIHISCMSHDYTAYVNYKVEFMTKRLSLYTQNKAIRLEFDSYIRYHQATTQLVNRLCPPGQRTLMFLGGSFQPADAPIKGYIKPGQQRLLNKLVNCPRVTVKLVDEFRTSITCSSCHSQLEKRSRTGRARGMYCPSCKVIWNRDVNAGRNMITAGLGDHYSHMGHSRPEALTRSRPLSTRSRIEVEVEVEEEEEEEEEIVPPNVNVAPENQRYEDNIAEIVLNDFERGDEHDDDDQEEEDDDDDDMLTLDIENEIVRHLLENESFIEYEDDDD